MSLVLIVNAVMCAVIFAVILGTLSWSISPRRARAMGTRPRRADRPSFAI